METAEHLQQHVSTDLRGLLLNFKEQQKLLEVSRCLDEQRFNIQKTYLELFDNCNKIKQEYDTDLLFSKVGVGGVSTESATKVYEKKYKQRIEENEKLLSNAKNDFNQLTQEYVKITTEIENLKLTLDNTLFSIETTLIQNKNSLQDARESWNEFQKDIHPIQTHEKTNQNKSSIIPDNIRARITPIGDKPGKRPAVLSSTPSLRKVSKSIKNTPSNKEILENARNHA